MQTHGRTDGLTDMTKLIVVFRDLTKSLTNKKRVNITFIVKLEKIARFLSEILLWRRLQGKLSILKKNGFKRHFESWKTPIERCAVRDYCGRV